MRQLKPKPKEKRDVPIPDALRDSLAEAWEIICESEDDEDIRIDFDDAIQCGSICGGRTGQGPRDFAFTFYPEHDVRKGRWFLELSLREIQDIGDGHQATLPLHCCTTCDTKFTRSEEQCLHCDYQDEPEEEARSQRLEQRATKARTRLEWIYFLLEEFPDADEATVIEHYNAIPGLGERLGWFSFEEAESLVAAARRGESIEPELAAMRAEQRSEATDLGRRAENLVTRLIDEDLLELVTSRSRTALISHVAELLESGCEVSEIASAIEEANGVAELFASDDDIRRLLS